MKIPPLPLLSIVVPIHSGLMSIENLRSWIYEVTNLSEIEIIAVLDGGHHEAEIFLNSQIAEGKSIRIKQVDCGNPGAARNIGLEDAKGEWVTFWDSDDYGYVGTVLDELKQADIKSEAMVGYAEIVASGQVRRVLRTTPKEMIFNPGIWRFVFRRSALLGIRFPELSAGEDQVFLARFSFLERKILLSDCFFYRYFIGSEGQLTKRPEKIDDSRAASSLVMEASFLSPNWATGYSTMSARLLMTFLLKGSGSWARRFAKTASAIISFRDSRYIFFILNTLIASKGKKLL
jgi:glycosyltransferase involved in cell wall biosynthesis